MKRPLETLRHPSLWALAVLVLGICACSRREAPADYPYAEWDRARVILMHTPGHELNFDLSAIEDEDEAASEAYRQEVLSKMSRADLIRCILLHTTVRLFRTDSNTGFDAEYIQDPLMNLYFTRDQSITTPRGHVICHMNSDQLDPETNIIGLCYMHLGCKPILRTTGEGRLEGGDYIPAGTASFIGYGAAHCMTQVLRHERLSTQ